MFAAASGRGQADRCSQRPGWANPPSPTAGLPKRLKWARFTSSADTFFNIPIDDRPRGLASFREIGRAEMRDRIAAFSANVKQVEQATRSLPGARSSPCAQARFRVCSASRRTVSISSKASGPPDGVRPLHVAVCTGGAAREAWDRRSHNSFCLRPVWRRGAARKGT